MKRLPAIALVALLAWGCLRDEAAPLAKVGDNVLYESDVRPLLPQGVSPEDSAAMVRQYINTWALTHLKVLKAQEALSPEAKNVSREVDEYRDNLLKFRLEKQVTDSELDTTVTDGEMRQYYEEHSQTYKYPYIIAKARIITLSQSSPNYATVKKTYAATGEDEAPLRELCASYAEKFEEFGGAWMPMPTIAKAVPGLDAESCETIFRGGDRYIKVGDGRDYFIFLPEKVPAGALAPYEYCRQSIRDAILNKRKQAILIKLEQDLLQEALDSKKLTIYDAEKQ